MTFASARDQLREKIRQVTPSGFDSLALDVFRFQAQHNPLYARYLELLGVVPGDISHPREIPFLPIQFFKNYDIRTGGWEPELVFTSSGTTAQTTSRHLVRDPDWYLEQTRRGFEQFYGDVGRFCVLALLPSYLERSGSSLVFMADHFIRSSGQEGSGFFLYNTQELREIAADCKKKRVPVLLLGVSFALLDLAEQGKAGLEDAIVMETGGMKGRRRELTREELHAVLKAGLGVERIHSEYGMTELFSQAYSPGEGIFYPSPAMRLLAREITDPFAIQRVGRTGALNVIDLGNIDTISFIATDDLGKVYADGSFEVLGRHDASDIRGCNLLAEAQ